MITLNLTEEEIRTLRVFIDRAARTGRVDAEMWEDLANDPDFPNASNNAKICREDVVKATALEQKLLEAEIGVA